jgi:hypothetical protein
VGHCETVPGLLLSQSNYGIEGGVQQTASQELGAAFVERTKIQDELLVSNLVNWKFGSGTQHVQQAC